jgi:hypothetical protein
MPYPIFQIDPPWVLEQEQLGTKSKFWFRAVNKDDEFGDSDWLFKYPTEGTGQHWAEKIAYEIAIRMHILAPRVELAVFEGERGSITENFTNDGYELFHGNQLLASLNPGYNPEQRFRQKDHTVEIIFAAIDRIFANQTHREKNKAKIAGYLILDALICNVDRHHENWGILRKITPDGIRGRLAPSYDHASSLGRELQDSETKQNRERYLHELGVAKYIERGRGAVFINAGDKYGPPPMELIKQSMQHAGFAPYFTEALQKIRRVDAVDFERIIEKIPAGWMTATEREFTLCLLSETHRQLMLLL